MCEFESKLYGYEISAMAARKHKMKQCNIYATVKLGTSTNNSIP